MTTQDEQELDDYIMDWYWDKPSHGFAKEVARFLFEFMEYLETLGLSRKTLDKHCDNCWCIGMLECCYGYHDKFSPAIFSCAKASFTYEFARKFSNSKYAIASYESTCRKLATFVKSQGYENGQERNKRA